MAKDDNLPRNKKSAGEAAATTSKIAVSSSIALIATSAMAQAANHEMVHIDGQVDISDEMSKAITSALNKRSIRDAVSESIEVLSSNVAQDGQTLSEKYLDGNTMQEWLVAQNEGSADFNEGSGASTIDSGPVVACYSNCHNACHGACHGSRGWR